MCGIAGAVDFEDAEKIVRKSLSRISYRGRDGLGICSGRNFCFGHLLHSVVGSTKQPIVKRGFIFGANCEIYNWREIAERHRFNSGNDAELMLDLLVHAFGGRVPDEKMINKALAGLDGVFAFFLYNTEKKYLLVARDVLGEKPVWFGFNGKGIVFASERKAIREFSPEELNPRKIILFDGKLNLLNQIFFEASENEVDIAKEKTGIKKLLLSAVEKRIPERKLGLLFSGGIDSALLAFLLKKKKAEFTCYTTASGERKDIEETARKLGLKLKIIRVTKEMVKKELPNVVRLIETADPVKAEVGLTMYFSLKAAQKDGVKVIFSGLGADDIFAGYKRMLASENINADSLSNLRKIYERDLYRDDVLSMAHSIELRLPYLDKKLVQAMLRIPSKYKTAESPKNILREIAKDIGLGSGIAGQKRKAAQYDSGIHKIIGELAKEKGVSRAGLFSKLQKHKPRLAALMSTGKDSIYALHIQSRLNYDIACLVTIDSRNKDSFMFHTPAIQLAKLQSEALEIPLVMEKTAGAKERELADLKRALAKAREKYKIEGIVTGALFSNYQRSRIEKICDELNLKVYSPLWHTEQETEMRNLLKEGFSFIFTKVAAEGLDKSWLGRKITAKDVDKLAELNKKLGINIAGEGGEFETLVLDCPMFMKKIKIEESETVQESQHSAELVIRKAKLADKN